MKWIFVNNTSLFDLKKAFEENRVIAWPQEKNVSVGDIIYFYISSPHFAIFYKCEVQEIDISQSEVDIHRYVLNAQFYKRNQKFLKIKLLNQYKNGIKINMDGKTNMQTSYQITDALYDYIEKMSKTRIKCIWGKWNIVLLLPIFIVSILIAVSLKSSQTMPLLVGHDRKAALELLDNMGLEVTTEEYYDKNYEPGEIISQSIGQGVSVEQGTTIHLTICNPWVEVIDTIDMKKEDAINKLQELGFEVDVETSYNENIEKGRVVAQSLEAGTIHNVLKERIELNISKGKLVKTLYLNEYKGYLDEYEEWYFYEYFLNQDYDKDGLIDRVYMNGNIEEITIQFGNGTKFEIPEFVQTTLAIGSADLTENDKEELIIYSGVPESTGPHMQGSLGVYTWNGNAYEEMELPFDDNKVIVTTRKIEGNNLKVGIQGTEFEHIINIEDKWHTPEEYVEWYGNCSEEHTIYQAYIHEYEGRDELVCRVSLLTHKDADCAEIFLSYINGEFVIRDVKPYSFTGGNGGFEAILRE